MVRDTITRIREHLQRKDVKKGAFALAAGLHPNTLIGVEREDWNPSADTLLKLEAQLPVEPMDDAA